MGPVNLRWFTTVLLPLVALGILFLTGCTQAATPIVVSTPTMVPTIQVSLLIQASEDDARWFRDVEVPKDTDAYELTELVAEGNLKATYYASLRSHFVEQLLGVENEDPKYWLIFLWDEGQGNWAPLPVGADLFSLKEGHVLAWARTDTSQEPQPLPSATP